MRSNIVTLAAKTILPANQGKVLEYPDGNTFDIIKTILDVSKISVKDTAKFAQYLKGADLNETLFNNWKFVFDNIKYQVDPDGIQWVKTPARTWADKIADCKSMSIFLASLLENQGIPFAFRFVSFNQTDPNKTHVYIIVPTGKGSEIALDVVTKRYNYQKPYFFKEDKMTKIYKMTGIGEIPKPIDIKINLGNKPIDQITDGEMELWIARDRLITEKNIVERIQGIGSLTAEKYQDSIDMVNDSLGAVYAYENGHVNDIDVELAQVAKQAISGAYSVAHKVCGIGSVKERIEHRSDNIKRVRGQRNRMKRNLSEQELENPWQFADSVSGTESVNTIGFLKKIAAAVKKGVKAVAKGAKVVAKGAVKVATKVVKTVAKVVTAPLRLAAKAILEVSLPKAAPFFLYLFINDQKIIDKLPTKVRAKRKKAESVANFIVNGIGMKRDHFMGIVRNGILKQRGKSPENIIADELKGKISGIGVIPVIVVTTVISIIQKLSKLLGKKSEDVSANDAPDTSDWGEAAADVKNALASEIKTQPENTSILSQTDPKTAAEIGPELNRFESGGRSIWNSLK